MSSNTKSTTVSWQEALTESAKIATRGEKARKQASALLWVGGKAAIAEFAEDKDDDPQGEAFYASVLDALGTPRKGDASKIKTVALAVVGHGLDVESFDNLSKAYAEARRLTQTVKAEKAEDEAGDAAVEAIADLAPKSTSKPEGAALLVLQGGLDEAARLLLDALNGPSGENNREAHKAFLRAVSAEVAGRVPKPEPKPAKTSAAKDGATKASKSGAAKAKPASGATKAKPKPAAKPAAKPVEDDLDEVDEIEDDIIDDLDDLFDEEFEDGEPDVEETPAPKAKAKPVAKPATKAKPAVRRPGARPAAR